MNDELGSTIDERTTDDAMPTEDDEENAIEREFESYLNEEDDQDEDEELLMNVGEDDEEIMMIDDTTDDQITTRRSKLACLNRVEYSIENVAELRRLAISSFGFVNKKFRRRAWPLLILSRSTELIDTSDSIDELLRSSIERFDRISSSQIQSHMYYNQVKLDVIRTLKRFPPEISDKLRSRLQDQLIDIICKVLIKAGGSLHYYQGYHDICLTFLLVTGATECLPLIENITRSHLTPFMETTMETTVKILYNMMPLIDTINPKLAEHLQKAELGIIFGLSWLITWYSHVMENLKVILRLYDLFIASDPLMPVYLAAIIVTQRSSEILSMDCDMATLHTVITKFPSAVEDSELVESYIELAIKLFQDYPPNKLAELNESWLSKCKRIQDEMAIERENAVRQRRKNKHKNNKSGNNYDSDSDLEATSGGKGKRKRFGKSRGANNKLVPANNRFLFGLTLTAGVMAVAMLAMNPSVVKEPQDLISKFYHLFNY